MTRNWAWEGGYREEPRLGLPHQGDGGLGLEGGGPEEELSTLHLLVLDQGQNQKIKKNGEFHHPHAPDMASCLLLT